MKQIFTFLFLVTIALRSIAQVTWSTPVTVTTGSAFGNLHPRVTLNRSGNPMVLWGKADTKAYFSRWNGTAFTAPVAVSGSFTVFAQSWAGPDIASFGDTVYATMKVTPEMTLTNYTYLAHSYDGGVTFSTPARIDTIGTDMSRFPIVTTTSVGNPMIAFMKFDASTMANARYVVVRSNDFGNTFSSDVQASSSPSGGEVCNCCPASILSSGSKAIMLYRNNLSDIRDIWAGISADAGVTFPNQLRVDTTNWMIMSCPSSGPDGFVTGDSLYSVFMSTSTGKALVHFGRASISGLTAKHSAITGAFTGLSSQNYPRIANAGSAAAVVWKQNTTTGNSIVYSFTNNISSGFPTYTVVPTATGSGMINADVAMTPGAIHIVWEDDNSGSVMYAKGTYTVPSTSIEPLVKKELIKVYPNPANESFTVSLTNINTIRSCFLTDNAGRNIEIKPVDKSGKVTFSLSGIAKGGYYFVMTDDAGKIYYSKLIVQ
jgi:hypothetical protein